MHFQKVSFAAMAALASASTSMAACTGPAINSASLSLIEQFEDFRANPYGDVGGLPTIGFGHLCSTSRCTEIPYAIPLSKDNARKLLASDVKVAQDCITNKTGSNVRLNANQYGALVSWAFNVGCGNVASSTLISRLNKGENPNTVAQEELPRWNKVNGGVVDGLTRRRAAEVALHQTATSTGALPAC